MPTLRAFNPHLAESAEHQFRHLIDLQIASWEMSLGDHRALDVDRPPPAM